MNKAIIFAITLSVTAIQVVSATSPTAIIPGAPAPAPVPTPAPAPVPTPAPAPVPPTYSWEHIPPAL